MLKFIIGSLFPCVLLGFFCASTLIALGGPYHTMYHPRPSSYTERSTGAYFWLCKNSSVLTAIEQTEFWWLCVWLLDALIVTFLHLISVVYNLNQ